MEVLGNNGTLKESETPQSPENNYRFRLPRDVNPNQRPRNETDVGLLVACKIQLSSEVIRWKTETLRLQKERDSAQSQAKELNQKVSKMAEKTKELETRLLQAEEENKHLKTRSHVSDEEKAALVQKLSQSVNKYHSYPWSETSPKSPRVSRFQASDPSEETCNEDWKEVSQRMVQKMKQEMKELQEMSFHLYNDDKGNSSSTPKDKDVRDEVQESILSLVSETESLKHHLLEQRQKLQSLFVELLPDDPIQRGYPCPQSAASPNSDVQYPAAKHPSSQSKPQSSKKSPVYLTKQLETLGDINRALKDSQPSQSPAKRDTGSPLQNVRHQNNPPTPKTVEECPRDEKVCPICQASFNATVSQELFEVHVLNHLENESTSLLDQYVVL
ncbi:hypothetical protein JTE90_019171 [Oedothorax gibbosus]|uniref:UBZ1-type domain-containing protein n=1 Tax=Oedothorax gibbosus TaxID=931172 RepID=A0AAV6USA5_9ARAC|nr:hypothetical protein JTE90_019171 [Oedothorax gibbosus]